MANIEFISKQTDKLIKRFNTRNPFDLCSNMGIKIRYKDLGKGIKAYFFYQSRIKNIVINQNTAPVSRRILCAHELGHAVLHKELAAMKGFHELKLFDSVSPAEYEANIFAAELLIDDDELMRLLGDDEKTFFSIAKELYVPAELLDFKCRILKDKGYDIKAPYISKSDFLKNNLPGFSLF